jgi:uncharacterized membrane protein
MNTIMLSTIGIIWSFIYALLSYTALPERVAVHFGINGNPDRYGTKLEAGIGLFLVPLILLGLQTMFWWIDKKETRATQKKILELTRVGTTGLLLVVQFTLVQAMQIGRFDSARLVIFALGLFFVTLGNFMPKIAPNAYTGVRIPWTFASDRAWYATNRLGGWVFAGIGLLLVISSLILPDNKIIWAIIAMVFVLFSSLPWLWFYAKTQYQTDPDRRPL